MDSSIPHKNTRSFKKQAKQNYFCLDKLDIDGLASHLGYIPILTRAPHIRSASTVIRQLLKMNERRMQCITKTQCTHCDSVYKGAMDDCC